jgi:hypothetical protein
MSSVGDASNIPKYAPITPPIPAEPNTNITASDTRNTNNPTLFLTRVVCGFRFLFLFPICE